MATLILHNNRWAKEEGLRKESPPWGSTTFTRTCLQEKKTNIDYTSPVKHISGLIPYVTQYKLGLRAGFRPDSNRENLKISPLAGRRPAGFCGFLENKLAEICPVSGPEALLRNLE